MPGISFGGTIINSIRHADDTVLIAQTESDLQAIVDTVNLQSEKYHMALNAKKKQVIVVSKKNENDSTELEITVNEERVLLVRGFKYLGTTICCDGKDDRYVKQKFATAKTSFNEMRVFFV